MQLQRISSRLSPSRLVWMIHKVVCWCSFCLVHLLLECVLSHRAVNTALWCNFLVFSLKFGVWISTSSHVMLAELVHSVTDFANQVWLCFAMAVDVIHFLSISWQEQRSCDLTAYLISGSSCIWFEQLKTCPGCSTPVCIISYFGI